MMADAPASCLSVFLPSFAEIHPSFVNRVLFQFFRRQFDGVVLFSRSGEHGGEAFHGKIQLHFDAFVHAEGTDAARSVANLFLHFGKGEHVGFHAEKVLELGIVDFCIPGSYN